MSIYDDPVVEEIRQRRQLLFAKEFGGSIKKMGDAVRKFQKQHPDKIVNMKEQEKLKKAS